MEIQFTILHCRIATRQRGRSLNSARWITIARPNLQLYPFILRMTLP
jgi:hypothetical protein